MLLRPIYDLLHRKLLRHDVLHADETTVQVLHEDGRRSQSKNYMWVYRTSGCAEHPIVLYKYEPTRCSSCAREFLGGFKGYLHTDGYHVYHNLDLGVTSVSCLVHARRKFHVYFKSFRKLFFRIRDSSSCDTPLVSHTY